VAATVSENFGTLLPYAPLLGERDLAAAHRFGVAFLHARRGLLEERVAHGFVRDCHGDLRAEHVIVEDGQVEVFDPLEFDPALREIDVSAEFASLVMYLMDVGADDLAAARIDEYAATGGDYGGARLLFFYAAYRAWVRAKVPGQGREISRWAMSGPGRSWRLAVSPGWHASARGAPAGRSCCHLRSVGDRADGAGARGLRAVRAAASELRPGAQGAGGARQERAGERQYTEEASLRTYCELGARAAATAAMAAAQLTEFEPAGRVPAPQHVLLRTGRPFEELVHELEAALDAGMARLEIATVSERRRE
jgi:hypothetical protein